MRLSLISASCQLTARSGEFAGVPRDLADAFSATALENPDGFASFNGIFRLRPTGVVERGLAILEVTASGFRVVGPAPQSFEAVGQ